MPTKTSNPRRPAPRRTLTLAAQAQAPKATLPPALNLLVQTQDLARVSLDQWTAAIAAASRPPEGEAMAAQVAAALAPKGAAGAALSCAFAEAVRGKVAALQGTSPAFHGAALWSAAALLCAASSEALGRTKLADFGHLVASARASARFAELAQARLAAVDRTWALALAAAQTAAEPAPRAAAEAWPPLAGAGDDAAAATTRRTVLYGFPALEGNESRRAAGPAATFAQVATRLFTLSHARPAVYQQLLAAMQAGPTAAKAAASRLGQAVAAGNKRFAYSAEGAGAFRDRASGAPLIDESGALLAFFTAQAEA